MYLKFNEWYNVAWVKCSKDADGERYLQRVSSVEERVGANKALHSFVYDDAHSLYHAQRTIGIPTACLTAYCGTIGLSKYKEEHPTPLVKTRMMQTLPI